MNRKESILYLCAFLALLCLTGCMPPGYSSEQMKNVTETYSDAAKAWFADNMQEAKPASAKAYADGLHLYALISGTYLKDGAEYGYFYDYKSGQMYTEEAYGKSAELAKKELAEVLGIGEGQIEFYPPDWHIATESLDDRDPDEYVNSNAGSICTNGLEVLPWDADPEQWGKKMIYEGLDDGEEIAQTAFALIYTESIPPYDPGLLKSLAGISSLDYIQPVAAVYDGICREDQAAGSLTDHYLHLEEWEPGLNIGYSYIVKECFDENGNTAEINDPFEGKDKDMHAGKLDGGRIGFTLPNGADALLLVDTAVAEKEYTDEYKLEDGSVRHPVWEESLCSGCRYMPGGDFFCYDRYSIVLPDNNARLFYRYEWGKNAYYDFSVNFH